MSILAPAVRTLSLSRELVRECTNGCLALNGTRWTA
jgi:hypothetical protein